ncbi:MAG: NUDIX hydrolase [Candidatus Levyibacteriota bacterium]|jgi:8-oxo-dGTP diphosphatase
MKQYQQVSTGALIFNNNKEALFVKRADDEDFEPGSWELPGGGSDFGETPEEALKREIKEECGIDIEVLNPIAVKTYYMENPGEKIQRVEIIFNCRMIDSTQKITLSFEHSAFKFLPFEKLDEIELSDYMNSIIKDIKALNTRF